MFLKIHYKMSIIINKLGVIKEYLSKHERMVVIVLLSFFLIRGITFEETAKFLLPISTLAILAVELILAGIVRVDIRELLIITGIGSFFVIWGHDYDVCIWLIIGSLLYFYLAKLIATSNYDNLMVIELVLVAFSAGIFILGVLDYIPFFCNRLFDSGEWIEKWQSFWIDRERHRTGFDVYFAPASGLFVYGVYRILANKKRLYGGAIVVWSLLAVGITCLSQGRMVLCGFAITTCVSLVMLIIAFWNNDLVRKLLGGIFIAILMGGILAYITYLNNWFGFGDLFRDSWLNGSMGLIHNIRFNMKADQIKLLAQYPMGNCEVPLQYEFYNNHAYMDPHDSWLEVARKGGIIPFFLLVLFSIIATIDLVKMWKNDSKDIGLCLALTGIFYTVNLFAWCEGVITGRPYMWIFIYFICGLIRGVNVKNEG